MLVNDETFYKLREWRDSIAERIFHETKKRQREKFQALLEKKSRKDKFTPINIKKVVVNLSKKN